MTDRDFIHLNGHGIDKGTKSEARLLEVLRAEYSDWEKEAIQIDPPGSYERLSTSVDASVDAQPASVDGSQKAQLDALKMMLDKGYTPDEIKGVLEALGKKSTDENGSSTDSRQRKDDLESLATIERRRERDRKYQAERRQKVKNTSDSSVDAEKRVSLIVSKVETLEGSKEQEESKRDSVSEKTPRVKNQYPADFEKFWRAYPHTPNMGKFEAFSKGWKKIPAEERDLAIAAAPKYAAWVKTQKPDYTILHAVRFLTKKRFDSFQAAPSQAQNFNIPPWEQEGITEDDWRKREIAKYGKTV